MKTLVKNNLEFIPTSISEICCRFHFKIQPHHDFNNQVEKFHVIHIIYLKKIHLQSRWYQEASMMGANRLRPGGTP